MRNNCRSKYYLDKRNAKFLGVLSGLAHFFGTEPLWIRIAFIFLVLSFAPICILLYFIAGFIADPMPNEFYEDEGETKKFWKNVRTSPTRTMRDINSRFRDIDRRLQEAEHYLTSPNRKLAEEIDKLK